MRAAARRHLAQRDAVGRPLHHRHSAFVHANLNWTLGPFKYVIAGPVFHRWHHTASDRGGNKNFAGTFPIWIFCSVRFTCRRMCCRTAYGIDDTSFPEGFGAQMMYPFQR